MPLTSCPIVTSWPCSVRKLAWDRACWTSHMCRTPDGSLGEEARRMLCAYAGCMRAQAGRQQLQDAAAAWTRGPPGRPASAPAARPADASGAGVMDEASLCPEVLPLRGHLCMCDELPAAFQCGMERESTASRISALRCVFVCGWGWSTRTSSCARRSCEAPGCIRSRARARVGPCMRAQARSGGRHARCCAAAPIA